MTLVHVVGLAPTKDIQVRLIYSQVLLLLSHTCAHEFQISNLRSQISNFPNVVSNLPDEIDEISNPRLTVLKNG
jgi:hypothetical protein